MGKLYDELTSDYRLKEGLNACINCGTCTAICPAAEFYQYDPRRIVDMVQSKDDAVIEELLNSDTIWYCGECMSCFINSEKGRQQYALTKVLTGNVLNYGYCVYPRVFKAELHPEAGPIWEWIEKNMDDVYARNGANLDGEGPGALRKIPQSDLDELKRIFDITGATERIENINRLSMEKAKELGLSEEEYFMKVFTESSNNHFNNNNEE